MFILHTVVFRWPKGPPIKNSCQHEQQLEKISNDILFNLNTYLLEKETEIVFCNKKAG